jgi:hypothetical protein
LTSEIGEDCDAASARSYAPRVASDVALTASSNGIDRWSRVTACVDYHSFVRPLPDVGPERWQEVVAELSRLGRCELDGCGVVTARGPWGFFLIPPRGFPEIKVCFYHRSSARRRVRQLQLLEACFTGHEDER